MQMVVLRALLCIEITMAAFSDSAENHTVERKSHLIASTKQQAVRGKKDL